MTPEQAKQVERAAFEMLLYYVGLYEADGPNNDSFFGNILSFFGLMLDPYTESGWEVGYQFFYNEFVDEEQAFINYLKLGYRFE